MTNFSTYLNRWPIGQIIYLVFFIKKYKIKSSLLAFKKKKKTDGILSYYYINYGENNKRCIIVCSTHFENNVK